MGPATGPSRTARSLLRNVHRRPGERSRTTASTQWDGGVKPSPRAVSKASSESKRAVLLAAISADASCSPVCHSSVQNHAWSTSVRSSWAITTPYKLVSGHGRRSARRNLASELSRESSAWRRRESMSRGGEDQFTLLHGISGSKSVAGRNDGARADMERWMDRGPLVGLPTNKPLEGSNRDRE